MERGSFTDPPRPRLFEYSAAKDAPLSTYPTERQATGLETMLSESPDATVMAHGGEFTLSRDVLEPVLEVNDNLYWTLDAGSMLNGLVLRASDTDDFAERHDNRKADFDRLVQWTLPWMMDAAPDRVTWGTDVAMDWNTEPKVMRRVMDWTASALESLPAEQRDGFAAENARGLFDLSAAGPVGRQDPMDRTEATRGRHAFGRSG